MRLACSTTIGHRAPLEEALERITQLGFDYADLLMAHGWAHVSPRELVESYETSAGRIRQAFSDHGLGISALNVAFSGPLYGRSSEDRSRRHEEAEAVVRLMEELDVSVAAVQPGGRPHGVSDRTLIGDAAASWQEITRIAISSGKAFALELHTGSPFDSPDAARELVQHVADTVFAFDPSHLVGEGIDLHHVGWILERAAHVHLRDAVPGQVQVPMGSGTVDFDWILKTLRSRSYDGFVAVEYIDTDEFDVIDSSRRLAEHLRTTQDD